MKKMSKNNELVQRFEYSNGTLKNKYNELDANRLRFLEYKVVNERMAWLLAHEDRVTIRSFTDLVKIHRFLFDSIYDWAGEVRNYEMSKGGTDFMFSESISMGISNINQQLREIKDQKMPDALVYAKLIDSLNYLHPFREGNGRSIRIFVQLLAANQGQKLSFDRQDEKIIKALANADIPEIANFIKLKRVGSKQAVIRDLKGELAKRQKNYQTYISPHKNK